MAPDRKRLACAVYTRKSSDEGLEQEFNSLDAQREACEAFIASQRHEGWKLVETRYDDGGFSGGNMDRPGLKRLLTDIRAGKVNVVVVYKVDRLTRALSDFAKIVEVLDNEGASFVSVTQQFNTTTSMGRLTLNVLLSFAQFEREVTGERIRDKIAASKKKGMWMGGVVPIGYDVKDRRLIVNKVEAETVRDIFRTYLRLKNARLLQKEITQRGILTKHYRCASGKMLGGKPFTRGHLYELLNNRLYLGEVVHKGQAYPGQHDAIVDAGLWKAVRDCSDQNIHDRSAARGVKHPSLLAGLIYDDRGNRLSPSHTSRGSIRIRYYVCRALLQHEMEKVGPMRRIPAQEIDGLVLREVGNLLEQPGRVTDLAVGDDASGTEKHEIAVGIKPVWRGLQQEPHRYQFIRSVIRRIVVGPDQVQITFDAGSLFRELGIARKDSKDFSINVPIQLTRCGRRRRLVVTDSKAPMRVVNESLVKLLEHAFQWDREVLSGKSKSEIAKREGLNASYVSRVVRLAFLAPDIIEAILDGRHKADLKVKRFFRNLPIDWVEQRRVLGFPAI